MVKFVLQLKLCEVHNDLVEVTLFEVKEAHAKLAAESVQHWYLQFGMHLDVPQVQLRVAGHPQQLAFQRLQRSLVSRDHLTLGGPDSLKRSGIGNYGGTYHRFVQ